jgi:MFS family permease
MSPVESLESQVVQTGGDNGVGASVATVANALPAPKAQSQWHVLLATWLGGVFDGMDSSIFAIVLFPALSELLNTKSHAVVGEHGSYIIAMFMIGWAVGAMLLGIVADYWGRARTLTFTILLYAICTGLCATATDWWQLGIYRFFVGAGIGAEMGIGAVMLSECWPNKSRVFAVSVMATSLGCGYLLTALLNLGLGHLGWRWLFVAGVAPAFLTVYIRAKLKEPEQFVEVQEKRAQLKGRDKSQLTEDEKKVVSFTFWELFNKVNLNKTLVVIAITGTALISWWAVLAWIPAWVNQLTGTLAVEQRSHAMFMKDFGMILSGLLGGLLIKKFGFKNCMAVSFALAFLTVTSMFLTIDSYGPTLLAWILGVGFFAHLPFVILWIYIPELFEARIRGTAFGFSYNIGRFGAAAAVLCSGVMIRMLDGNYAIAASTVACIYLLGLFACMFMPKTQGTV